MAEREQYGAASRQARPAIVVGLLEADSLLRVASAAARVGADRGARRCASRPRSWSAWASSLGGGPQRPPAAARGGALAPARSPCNGADASGSGGPWPARRRGTTRSGTAWRRTSGGRRGIGGVGRSQDAERGRPSPLPYLWGIAPAALSRAIYSRGLWARSGLSKRRAPFLHSVAAPAGCRRPFSLTLSRPVIAASDRGPARNPAG